MDFGIGKTLRYGMNSNTLISKPTARPLPSA
jgi:hypothetical protein